MLPALGALPTASHMGKEAQGPALAQFACWVRAEGEGAGVTRRSPLSIHRCCGGGIAVPKPGERSALPGMGAEGLLSDALPAITTHSTLFAGLCSPSAHKLLGPGVMSLCRGWTHAGWELS